jgi:transcription elongation factor GreA
LLFEDYGEFWREYLPEGVLVQRIPLTPEGFRKLNEELEKLVKVDRPKNVQAIAEARAHGDLSENAEYHAAKEQQSFIAGRIQELKSKIAMAQVIDPSKIKQSSVGFGAKVKVLDTDADTEYVFVIVGPEEADAKHGKISLSSPVGKALIGKEVGDTAVIKAPARTIEYEIIEITFE